MRRLLTFSLFFLFAAVVAGPVSRAEACSANNACTSGAYQSCAAGTERQRQADQDNCLAAYRAGITWCAADQGCLDDNSTEYQSCLKAASDDQCWALDACEEQYCNYGCVPGVDPGC